MTDWKTCPLEPGWLAYWENVVRIVSDGGFIGTSVALFRLDKEAKTLTILIQTDAYVGSKEDILNQRCLEALGWRIVPKFNPENN